MRVTARMVVSLGLSLTMALGTVPSQALAEALEGPAIEMESEGQKANDGTDEQSAGKFVGDEARDEREPSEEEAAAGDKDDESNNANPGGEVKPSETDDSDEAANTSGRKAPEASKVSASSDDSEATKPPEPEATTQSDVVATGTWGTCPWEITKDGMLTVHPGEGADPATDSLPEEENGTEVVAIRFIAEDGRNVVAPESCYELLAHRPALQTVDASGLDTSNVTNMQNMFTLDSNLVSVDCSTWDTSNVQNMAYMFSWCENLTTVDVSGWNTSNVEYMTSMFGSCSSLEAIDVSGWDVSNLQNTWSLFEGCSSLRSLDLSGWNTSSSQYANAMFSGCSSLSLIRVGENYEIKCGASTNPDPVPDGFPQATSANGKWWSQNERRWFTRQEIFESRNLIADTYTAEGDGIDPADPTAEGSVYGELKAAYDEARAAADAAEKTLAEKQQAYDDALAALTAAEAEVGEDLTRLQDAADAAKQELDDAQADRDAKQQALEAANDAVTANADAIANAERDLADAQADVTTKERAVNDAVAAKDSAQAAYDDASGVVSTAQAAIDAETSDPKSNANHEEWTALGLFRHILQNTSTSDEAHWDAQCAIDILTSGTNTTGHSYKQYQGPVPDGAQGAGRAGISGNVVWASRSDAVSLNNFSAALDYIDEYNQYRAKENREEGYSLTTNVGMNCRLMAIAAVQLDVSQDYNASGGHTQAYHVGENLSWGYSDPFDGWYTEEKADWKAGSTSGVGHYMNIVDQLPKGSQNPTMGTGFAVHTAAPLYRVAHGQVFHTTSGYSSFNPNITYTTSEFRSQWFDSYYQQQVEAGMFGTTEAVKSQHRQALADAKAVQAQKKSALDEADAALRTAQSAKATADAVAQTAQNTLDGLRSETGGLEEAASSAQSALDEASAAVTEKQSAYDIAQAELDSFDGTARIEAAQAAVDDAQAARDEAQRAKQDADNVLARAAEALGVAKSLTPQNTIVEGIEDATYDGTAHTQDAAKLFITMSNAGRSETYELVCGVDYEVAYASNTNAGTATVTFEGRGDYEGSATAEFRIAPAAITGMDAIADATYTGSAIRPKLVVRAGNLTLGAADFTATYANNTNAGTATVNIEGKGNFKGSATTNFKINKAANPITVVATKASVPATYKPSAATVTGKNVTVSKAQGTVTYANASTDATAKTFVVDKSAGKVTLPKATKVGTYFVKVKVTAAGNANYNAGSKTVSYKIVVAKAANPIAVKATKASLPVTYKPSATSVTAKNVTVTGTQGTSTYANASTDATAKKFVVNKTTGKVTVPKATKAGTYVVKVKVTAAGNANYNAGSKIASYKIVVAKAANPMVAKAANKTASLKTLKTKAVTVARPITITKQQGKLTYAKVASGSSAALTVNKTTGKVTVKKGAKKGTYTIKIKVTAAGNANYKAGSKTVTCKVVVK